MKQLAAFLILCIFIFLNTEGQTNKYNTELYLRPSLNYLIKHDFRSGKLELPRDRFDISASFDYGFLINCKRNEKTTFGFGLIMARYSNTNKVIIYEWKPTKSKWSYFSPVILLTKTTKNKRYFTVGLHNNILYKAKTKYYDFTGDYDSTVTVKFPELINDKIRIYNPGISLSYGFRRQFGNDFSVLIQPVFEIMILSNSRIVSGTNFFEFGINFHLIKE